MFNAFTLGEKIKLKCFKQTIFRMKCWTTTRSRASTPWSWTSGPRSWARWSQTKTELLLNKLSGTNFNHILNTKVYLSFGTKSNYFFLLKFALKWSRNRSMFFPSQNHCPLQQFLFGKLSFLFFPFSEFLQDLYYNKIWNYLLKNIKKIPFYFSDLQSWSFLFSKKTGRKLFSRC